MLGDDPVQLVDHAGVVVTLGARIAIAEPVGEVALLGDFALADLVDEVDVVGEGEPILADGHLAGGVDLLAVVGVLPLADGVEVFESEPGRVDEVVTGGALLGLCQRLDLVAGGDDLDVVGDGRVDVRRRVGQVQAEDLPLDEHPAVNGRVLSV